MQVPHRAQERERSDELDVEKQLSKLTVGNEIEFILITHIRATDVAVGLRRIPVGFYVVVKSENATRRTSNKAVSVRKDVVEWDDEIVLPSDRSSRISFTVIASFELGSTLGGGEVLREFEITVGDFLDCNGQLECVEFLEQGDEGVICSPSAFEIKIEKRVCYSAALHPPEPERMCPLAELTDRGHRALIRFRQLQEQGDLDESIRHFEHARDLCPLDHPTRATVLFNLATAKLIYCRMNVSPDLDMPIDLYRDALHLRPRGHPDHLFTLLSLGIAIEARSQRQHDETDVEEGEAFLSQVLDVAQSDSYAYHVAVLALGSTAKYELVQPTEIPQAAEDDFGDDGVVQRLDTALKWVFHPDSDEHVMLDHLGILFCIRFDSLGDLADPEKAISMLEVIVQFTSDTHPGKPSWLDELGYLLLTRYENFGNVADLEKSISMLEDAVQITPDVHPDKPLWLDNLGHSVLTRYKCSGNLADLERVIYAREEAVQSTHDGHPDKPLRLGNLGSSLSTRYKRFGDPVDLEKSISVFRDAVQIIPDGHPDKPSWLNNLGHSLLTRYEHFGDVADLENAISVFEGAIQSTPDGHPDKPLWLNNLTSSLSTRYQRFGDAIDLQNSILMLESMVQSTPDDNPGKPTWQNNLGHLFLTRYERFGDAADLEESISLREAAVQSMPDDHLDKPSWLCSLGNSLLTRYERFGDVVDLKRSVSMFEGGVQSTPDDHPNKPLWLNYLGNSLLTRFAQFGDIVDLDRSISMFKDAVQFTPDGHQNKSMQLNNLGESLLTRYERFGDVVDLQRSISMFEDAVQITPDGHPDKPIWLGNLGHLLSTRYKRFGDVVDLERSISIRQDVLQFTPDGHPDRPARLNDLGCSLSTRYEDFGDVVDLEKSISMLEDAVRLTPDGHLNKPSPLANLSHSLLVRYQRFKDVIDLERSISIREDAVQSTPDGHPNKPSQLINLGHSFFTRYERFKDIADLEKAILMFEGALQFTPDGHPNKPSRLGNLGHSLLTRYKRFEDVADLERSLPLFEDAIQFTPDGHPDKPSLLNAVSLSLLERFQRSCDLSSADLPRAITYSSHAARSHIGPSLDRFRASQTWIQCARHLRNDPQSLLDAYRAAIDLLPQLAWIGLSFHDRYHQLLKAADETCDAAAAALEVHKPELAVEWLEQGRSIMWTQLSQLRTPVNDLRAVYPELAARFERVSHELERASARDGTALNELAKHSYTMDGLLENQARQHHTLALSRERLLAEIRALPGFERFLLPKMIGQLSPLVHSGPVVFLNASKHRCDALVVMAGSERVVHVPLSSICYDEVAGMQLRLSKLLRLNDRVILRGKDRGARLEGMRPDEVFGSILPSLWNKVVNPILEALTLSTSPGHKLPRIFWCPTGPFTFLPIHAAGLYDRANAGPKLSDFAISSYIPTMSALELPLQGDPKTTSNNIRLLAVSQPSTDGQVQLTGVRREIEVIRELTSSSPFVGFQEADGTVEDVLAKMTETDWVHFACHGTQDHATPLDSGLPLAHLERLKLSNIVQLSRPHGGLAFLSACQTATGDENLSDEAIHLAAGMLLAGYRGVIATMWSIMDRDAPRVAEDVYKGLFQDDKVPDSSCAAEALHHAIERLRDSGAPFLSWVPFIHVGL